MAVSLITAIHNYIGESGDVKPTGSSVPNGSRFYEKDTTTWFIYDGVDEDWSELTAQEALNVVVVNDTALAIEAIRDAVGEWRLAEKAIVYTGDPGAGAQGTVDVFAVTGDVEIAAYYEKCTTNLVGAATLASGIASNTQLCHLQVSDVSAWDAGAWDEGGTPGMGAGVGTLGFAAGNFAPIAISEDIIQTIGAADITAGVIKAYCKWRPLSDNGALVAA